MRILFLVAQLPEPPHAGGALRTNGLMRGVQAAGHEVHVLAFGTREQLDAQRAPLDEFCTSVEVVPPPQRTTAQRLRDLLFTQAADMQRRFASPAYATALAGLLARQPFDLVQIESLEMAIYLPVIRQHQPQTPVIYDSFNAEFDLQRTIYRAERGDLRQVSGTFYSLIQWRRLVRFEHEVCRQVAHVIAVSDADANAFKRLAPGCPVSVVPNGVNAQEYARSDTSLDLGEAALVFTGSMSYRPNVDAALWFADRVLPAIRTQVPQTRFFVVGSNPHPRLAPLRERDNVQVTGWVPEVNPFLHAATVYVAPLRMGSGTRLKLLQAMAAGRGIVTTRTGAQGLSVQDGAELRLADTAEDFAIATLNLLEDPSQRKQLGQTGQAFVRAHYDWSVIVPALLEIYDSIIT